MVAAFIAAAFMALFGPTLVTTLVLGSGRSAIHMFGEAGPLMLYVAAAYIVAIVAITVFGVRLVRGQRVPHVLLHTIALSPWVVAVVGACIRDKRRVTELAWSAIDEDHARAFGSATRHAEQVLAIGATMTAFAMLLVALASISSHAERRASLGLLVTSSACTLVFAASAAHSFAKEHALRGVYDDEISASSLHVVDRIAVAVVIAAMLGAFALAIRARALHGSKWAPSALITTAFLATPFVVAMRDDALFAADFAPLPAGIHAPVTRVWWEPAHAQPRMIVAPDGSKHTEGPPLDKEHPSMGLVVDGDMKWSALHAAAPEKPDGVYWFDLYLDVMPSARANIEAIGSLGRFLGTVPTTTLFSVGSDCGDDATFALLDDKTARVFHEGELDAVVSIADDQPSRLMRQSAFRAVKHLTKLCVAPRDTDTVSRAWIIADDAHVVAPHDLRIVFVANRRTPEQREADRAAFFKDWVY